MNEVFQNSTQGQEKNLQHDQLWDLLSSDAEVHPVAPSPWFAARTVAKARSLGQWRTRALLFRWLMPIPLAGLAAVALLSLHGIGTPGSSLSSNTYISSNSDFEAHMELMSSSME
jgi:hypothetical protein